MPLKHDTETLLVFLLGLMIALAGAVSAFLPPLSVSVLPWALAFALSIAYVLLLYPLLRSRRADYPFRLLHGVPALILFVWVLSELLAAAVPALQVVQTWYTFAWSAPAVLLGFFFLIRFCLQVIRQREQRIGLLLAIVLPFLLLGQWSEYGQWDRRLTAQLWNGNLAALPIAGTTGNLLPSLDPMEEQWRVELRLMEQRRQQILSGGTGGVAAVIDAPSRGARIAAGGLESVIVNGDVVPPQLPSSGFGMEGAAVMLLAGYCAMLHRRTMLRTRNA